MEKALKLLKKRLDDTILENDWNSHTIPIPEQSRVFFTAICYLEDIYADTKPCDDFLWYLYDLGDLEDCGVDFEDFQNFMVGLIV